MGFLRGVLAIVGLFLIGIGGISYWRFNAAARLDPQAGATYATFAKDLWRGGNPVESMVHSVRVKDGISADVATAALKAQAQSHNLSFLDEPPPQVPPPQAATPTTPPQVAIPTTPPQVAIPTTPPQAAASRRIHDFTFGDAQLSQRLAAWNSAYAVFLPCRVSLVEDEARHLWFHAVNLDPLIHGGRSMPPDLRQDMQRMWDQIRIIMDLAAKGAA
ncbi:MAG: hypothetical protein HQL37_03720 [Alphaproteobacteria bacterium]|nr:hypothetical protein [Alphaproteobacteria bacterium]